MLTWSVSYCVSLLVFTGCVAASTPPPSPTLAYILADRPATQPGMSMAPMQQGGHGVAMAQQQGQQTVVGEGKVVAVVPGSSQIVVDHKAIPGFMDAMTMGYRIEPSLLLEGVKVGDSVRFTINTQRKAIIKLEKLQQ